MHYLGRFEWIIWWEVDSNKKHPPSKWAVWRTHNCCLPMEHVLTNRAYTIIKYQSKTITAIISIWEAKRSIISWKKKRKEIIGFLIHAICIQSSKCFNKCFHSEHTKLLYTKSQNPKQKNFTHLPRAQPHSLTRLFDLKYNHQLKHSHAKKTPAHQPTWTLSKWKINTRRSFNQPSAA